VCISTKIVGGEKYWLGEEEADQVRGQVEAHLVICHHGKDPAGYTEEVLAGGFPVHTPELIHIHLWLPH